MCLDDYLVVLGRETSSKVDKGRENIRRWRNSVTDEKIEITGKQVIKRAREKERQKKSTRERERER